MGDYSGSRGGGYGEKENHKAICGACGNDCTVPFKPIAGRAVYCRECFAKRKKSGN